MKRTRLKTKFIFAALAIVMLVTIVSFSENQSPAHAAEVYHFGYIANSPNGSVVSNMPNYVYGVQIPCYFTLDTKRPTCLGYDFKGWSTSPGGPARYGPGDHVYIGSSGHFYVYAIWQYSGGGGGSNYTLNYNANGGSGAPGSQSASANTYLTISYTEPWRTGYTFLGWSENATPSAAQYQPGDSIYMNSSKTLYAVWLKNDFTLSYNANGGSGAPNPQTAKVNTYAPVSYTEPWRTGYTFQGWSENPSASSPQYYGGNSIFMNGDKTLYAVWSKITINTYTLTYNANGGSGAPGPQTANAGNYITVSYTEPYRQDHAFLGWAKSPTAANPDYYGGNPIQMNSDITLHAVWKLTSSQKYAVTYYPNGGTGAANTVYVYAGNNYTIVSQGYSMYNHIFAGWNTNPNGSGTDYSNDQVIAVNNNIDLYAQWSSNIQTTYVVSYFKNDTGTYYPQEPGAFEYITFNSIYTIRGTDLMATNGEELLKKDGYIFVGWNTTRNGTGTAYAVGEKIVIDYAKQLFAQWQAIEHTITYDPNGGEGSIINVKVNAGGSHTVENQNYEKDGNDFAGYNTKANGSGTQYPVGYSFTVDNDIALFAQWDKIISYTLTYDANGGIGAPAPVTAPANSTIQLSGDRPSREGYTFVGWGNSKLSSDDLLQPGDPFNIGANDHILYAQWSANTCTLNYDANGGSGAPGSQSGLAFSGIDISETRPTRANHDFEGWATTANANSAQYQPGDTFTFAASDVTLFAVWKASIPQQFIVMYYSNGGGGSMPADYPNKGDSYTVRPNAFTKSGYTFDKWNTMANGNGVSYTAGQVIVINDPVYLYAQWKDNNIPTGENGRTLNPEKSGDKAKWIEIARYGNYSLILRADVLSSSAFGATNHYLHATARDNVNNWFNNTLSGSARLRDYTVKHDAATLAKLGDWASITGGFSIPSTEAARTGNDVAFLLSFAEAASFCSTQYATSTTNFAQSKAVAITNFNKLTPISGDQPENHWWLRTAGYQPDRAGTVGLGGVNTWNMNGAVNSYQISSNAVKIRPALWVDSAIFDDNYTVTYNPNGGSGPEKSVTVIAGSNYTIENQGYSWNGYTFDGWNTRADGNGTNYDNGQSIYVTGSITLFAKWKVNPIKQYVITYYPNGGTGSINKDYADENTDYKIVSQEYYWDGYIFNGWNTKPDGTGTNYTNGQSIYVNCNISLHAQWLSNAEIPNAEDGRTLIPDLSGDNVNWIEIARYGNYSLIVRTSYLNHAPQAGHYNDPNWQYTAYSTNGGTYYPSSSVYTLLNAWFNNQAASSADNLPNDARMRRFTMENNALDKLGNASNLAGLVNGFSKPASTQRGIGSNIVFALSYSESAAFLSNMHFVREHEKSDVNSSETAKRNWAKIHLPLPNNQGAHGAWLRSVGDISGTVGAVCVDGRLPQYLAGRAFQIYPSYTQSNEYGYLYPALWVDSAIFTPDTNGKSEPPHVNDITKGDDSIGGQGEPGASIVVTLPDGTELETEVDEDGKWTVDIPDDKELETGDKITVIQTEDGKYPSDAVEKTVDGRPGIIAETAKTSRNLSRNDGTRRVGDKLEYTISAKNAGEAKSLWLNVLIVDTLPAEVDYVAGSVKIDGIAAGPAAAYNTAAHTLTVNLGNIAGGVTKTVTFEALINDQAYGKVFKNTAIVGGEETTEGPGEPPAVQRRSYQPEIDDINEGDRTVSGTGVTGAAIEVSFPNSTAKATATVGVDGKWNVNVPGSVNLLEGDIVKATQTEPGYDSSLPAEKEVKARGSVQPYMSKRAENLTSDDKLHVNDRLKYTIVVGNNGAKSVWTNAVMRDELPEGVTFAGNVTLDGITLTTPAYIFNNGVLAVALGDIPGGSQKVITFEVTVDADAYNKDIKNAATVDGKANGGNTDVHEETEEEGDDHTVTGKSAPPQVNDITKGDDSVGGQGEPGANIVVTLPDGSELETEVDEDGNWTVDIPDDKELETGDKITVIQTEDGKEPSDAVEKTVDGRPGIIAETAKTSRNLSRDDGTRRVGDKLEYSISAKNAGEAKSLWLNVLIVDTLPAEVDYVAGSVKINGIAAGSAAAYDAATHTLTVNLGNIAGGVTKTVTFEALINDQAYGKEFKNTAIVGGEETTEGPGDPPAVQRRSYQPEIDDINEGDRTVSGTGIPGAAIEVSFPHSTAKATATVGADGKWSVNVPGSVNLLEGDIVKANQTEPGYDSSLPAEKEVKARGSVQPYMSKTAENLSSKDGKIHVNDRLKYTIVVGNNGAKSVWTNAVMRDELPAGVSFAGNVTLNGITLTMPSYIFANGVLTVALGDIPGGSQKVVTFEVTVDADAYDKDIKNAATVDGKANGGNTDVHEETEEEGDDHTVTGKSKPPQVNDITKGDDSIGGQGEPGANIVVMLPDGTELETKVDEDGNWTVDIPDDKELETGDKITVIQTEDGKEPSDAVEKTVDGRPGIIPETAKTSRNLSRNDGTRRVGDKLEYTISAKNAGEAKSLWLNVLIVDTLPAEVDYVAGSVKINGIAAGSAAAYDAATHTLTVNLGNIAGGATKTVTFEALINDQAYGKVFKNTAIVGGEETTEGPGEPPAVQRRSYQPEIDDINEGDRTVSGTGLPGATIEVSFPHSTAKATATVGADGKWNVNVPGSVNLLEGDIVKATQTEPGYDSSLPAEKEVKARGSVQTYMSKTAENLSSKDGKLHVNDRLKYTIVVGNNGAKSVWTNAVMRDELPAGVTFAGNVTLNGITLTIPNYIFNNGVLTVALGDIPGGSQKVITFEATVDADAYDKDIKNAATVDGKGNGGNTDVHEETEEEGDDHTVTGKSKPPQVNDITKGDDSIAGKGEPGANIVVTLPDGTELETKVDEDGNWTVDIPEGKELETGDKITVIQTEDGKEPSDAVEKTVGGRPGIIPETAKTSRNLSRDDGTRRVGDKLEYTISAKNAGEAKSLWLNVLIVDTLPAEVDFVAGSVKINGIAAGGAAAYDAATRTLTVNLGNIASGVTKRVTFEALINDQAYGKVFKNTAIVGGEETTEGPGEPPAVQRRSYQPEIDDINEGDRTVSGTGLPGAAIEVSFPNSTVKATATVGADGKWNVNVPGSVNLLEGDIVKATQTEPGYDSSLPAEKEVKARGSVQPYMSKTAENLSSKDGKIHVNDRLKYTIVVGNNGAKSMWTNAIMRDELPEGVTFASNVTLNGITLTIPNYIFNNGVLTVALGDIPGGSQKVITFEVTVDADAYDKDIKNAATVDGKGNGGNTDVHEETEEEGDDHIVTGKSAPPTVDDITKGDDSVGGKGEPGANIVVTLPDGTELETEVDKDGKWTVDIPDDKELETGDKITVIQTEDGKEHSDAVEKTVDGRPGIIPETAKTSRNLSRDDGTRRVGDRLEYCISAKNAGEAKSLWLNVLIVDTLPAEVDFVTGSVKINGIAAGAAAYDAATHTLTVNLGNIAGGVTKTMTFEALINDQAYGKVFKNTAIVGGEETTEGPGDPPAVQRRSYQPEIDDINEGDRTVSGTGIPGAAIEVSFPNSTVKATATVGADGKWNVNVPGSVNLLEGDIVKANQTEPGYDSSLPAEKEVKARGSVQPYMSKTAENLSSKDGKIHVNDRLKYTIVVGNNGAKSVWTNAVMRDELPEGVTFAGNVTLNGITLTTLNYIFANGVLTVALGDIAGGSQKVVTFEVTVDADAYDKDIKNAATVDGKANGGNTDVHEETEEEGDDHIVTGKSAPPTVDDITKGDDSVGGKGEPGANIVVTLPDGTELETEVDEDGNWTVDIPDDKELETGDKITVIQTEDGKEPSDAVEKTVDGRPGIIPETAKTSRNLSRNDGTRRVGDKLEYTISAKNAGEAKSLWLNVLIVDTLPAEVDFVTGSVKINGIAAGPAAAYNAAAHTLTVNLGNIAGGVTKTVTFEALINDQAYGKVFKNTAIVGGEETTEGPGDPPAVQRRSYQPEIDDINEGDRTVSGTGIPGAAIEVSFPHSTAKATATVGADGKWSANVPGSVNLLEGDIVKATQTEPGYDSSLPAEQEVKARGSVQTYMSKKAENLSSKDGKIHVNDRLKYTIVVGNNGAKSVWTNAIMRDELPEGVTFAGNVTLNGITLTTPAYIFANGVLTVALGDIAGGSQKVITFEVTVDADAYDKDIKNAATVDGKANGGNTDVHEETEEEGDDHTITGKSKPPQVNDITKGDDSVGGQGEPGANIVMTLPDGTELETKVDEDGKWTVDIPDDKELETGDKITVIQTEDGKEPSDAVEKTVGGRPGIIPETAKTSRNLSRDDGTRRVGDRLEYTISAKNAGEAKSLWLNVLIVDTLPAEVDFVTGSVKINGVAAGGAAAYDAATRTLTVNLGNIAGGVTKTVTFEAVINDKAYGKVFKNTAIVGGEETTEGPGEPPAVQRRSYQPEIDDINEGDRTVSGTGIPGAAIEVSFPNSTVKATATVGADGKWSVNVPGSVNLLEGDIVKANQTEPGYDSSLPVEKEVKARGSVQPYMSKTAENLSSKDGKIHVNDRLKYTIVVGNNGAKSVWTNAVMRDELPEGVSFAGNVTLNGITLTTLNYIFANGVLTVALGDIAGGSQKVVTFEVTVDADAYDKDIKNAATVDGKANGGNTDVHEETEEEGDDHIVTGKSAPPTVNDITKGDDSVGGKGEPGANIVVKLPDGTELETEVDKDGKWTVDIPDDKELKTGDKITVIQTEDGKEPSDAVEVIVKGKNTRTVHGFVWPMVDDDWGLGDSFLRKHDIVVELRATFQTPAAAELSTTTVLVANSARAGLGEFTIENVPYGDYILVIKRPGHLVRAMKITVSASDNDIIELAPPNTDPTDKGVFSLWWGDCNDDFRIDNEDIMMIMELMKAGVHANHPWYDAACDLNADGRCDNEDIMWVRENWNRHVKEYAGGENINYSV